MQVLPLLSPEINDPKKVALRRESFWFIHPMGNKEQRDTIYQGATYEDIHIIS